MCLRVVLHVLCLASLLFGCAATTPRLEIPHPDRPSPNVEAYRNNSTSPPGSISKEAIRQTISNNINDVKHCFMMGQRRRSPGEARFQGWVLVHFVIARDGTLPALDLVHAFDERSGECIVNYMSRWTFPQPHVPGDIYVTYPFHMVDP